MKNKNPGLGLCLAVLACSAAAETPVPTAGMVTVDIKSQPVGSALNELAQQAGMQVIFYSDVAEGIRAQAVAGTVTPDVALQRLLLSTGLTYEYVNSRTVAVKGVESQRIKTAAPPVMTLAALQTVIGESGDPSQETNGRDVVRPDSSDRQRDRRIEEVIVTAQKREERLIDVPQSVTVLSPDALAKAGAVQFRDFADTVPGLNFTTTGAGRTKISLRGVTVGSDISPTVGIYVDDVPYGSSSAITTTSHLALDVGLFDLDRIEVLRGPQGTLWGASTMGGLIKYVSKQPDSSRFGVDVQTGVSDTHNGGVGYNGMLAINAPLATGKAAVRASGFYSHDSGYVDNLALNQKDVDRSDVYGGRVNLSIAPSEALTVGITGFLQEISRDGDAATDFDLQGVPIDGSLDQRSLIAEPFDQSFRLLAATVNYNLDWGLLTSISGYQEARSEWVFDLSAQFVPLLAFFGRSYSAVGGSAAVDTDKFTQEIRLTSQGTGPLEWLIGAFYTYETSENRTALVLRDEAGQPAPNDLLTALFPSRYEEYAAFGDLTWHMTEKLDATAGVRYAHNWQKFEQTGSGLFFASNPVAPSSEDVSTYLANARYRISDHTTGYVRYATGYRPGGSNAVVNDPTTGLPAGPPTFEADRLKSYEAGFKAETADRAFGIDLAGYYIDWDNIQISVVRGGLVANTNAPGGATILGAELAITAQLARSFTFTGVLAYQDAELAEADPDLQAAKGERLPNVPRFSAALNADYELPIGSLQPKIGATVRYVDDRTSSFGDSTSNPQYHLPDYTTVDLRAGMTLGSVDVQFYIRNLFDERGQLSVWGNASPDLANVAILQPRSVGATIRIAY